MRRATCVLVGVLSLAACTSEPRRPLSTLDPSSPDAPEAPPAPLPSAFLAAKPASVPDAGTAPVYTCPMHPEVRSEQPGRCPKCGMKLTPTQPGATDAGPPRHEHGAHP